MLYDALLQYLSDRNCVRRVLLHVEVLASCTLGILYTRCAKLTDNPDAILEALPLKTVVQRERGEQSMVLSVDAA